MVTPQVTAQPSDTDHDMEGATYIAKVCADIRGISWLEHKFLDIGGHYFSCVCGLWASCSLHDILEPQCRIQQ